MALSIIELSKKVRYTPRKKKADGEPKMDLVDRIYADEIALQGDLKLFSVQIDCAEGLRRNSNCRFASSDRSFSSTSSS